MEQFVIGLDFGTYQTKICINHLDKIPSLHEFYEFKNSKNSGLFLPSRVYLLKDQTFRYGNYSSSEIHQTFNYFKIASAEDPIFHLLGEFKEPIYNIEGNFGEFAPEFLSVLYITSILLEVKEHFKSGKADGKKRFSLSNFFSRSNNKIEEVDFFVRLGVPTEWNKKINLARRRKFEMILLISEYLQKKVDYSSEKFHLLTKDELLKKIRSITDEIKDTRSNFNDLLGTFKISVSPESAAGILYLIQTKKLDRGLYAAIDIGGGTSDISFFNIDYEHKIKYLASESIMVACNNIYIGCSENQGQNTSQWDITKIEHEISDLIDSNKWQENKNYILSTNKVKQQINNELKFLFSNPVWKALVPNFKFENVLEAFADKPCFIYGGGIKHPKLKMWEKILIFESNHRQTYMQPFGVEDFAPNRDKIKNEYDKWSKNFYLLVVAFGLSYLRHDGEAEEWDDSQYESTKTDKKLIEVPHPRNEGFYIYDVIERKWHDRK